jgi:hypothetical protein
VRISVPERPESAKFVSKTFNAETLSMVVRLYVYFIIWCLIKLGARKALHFFRMDATKRVCSLGVFRLVAVRVSSSASRSAGLAPIQCSKLVAASLAATMVRH